MVTDGILKAVEKIIENLKSPNEIGVGLAIWDMLAEYDEDKWYQMDEEQKKEWIKNFI